MNPLEQIIIERITREGPITFESFMDMALYHPEFGYYASSESAIGREGDFFTGPHLHPIFGAMIGRQMFEMWESMGKPSTFDIAEVGAGHGYLARDILDYLTRSDRLVEFIEAIHYIVVEPYKHFEDRQRAVLVPSLDNPPSPPFFKGGNQQTVTWVKSLRELNDIKGCIVTNELLDAFPVHLIRMNNRMHEIYVNYKGDKFIEETQDISSDGLKDYIKAILPGPLPPGYRTEINLRMRNWLAEAAAALKEGFVLTIDYGYSAKEYYSEDRTGGTLLCYHKHTLEDSPYLNVGRQDITAHVNFSSLKSWGEELGLKAAGYCPQGTFLTAAGIDEVITECYAGAADYLSELSKIKRLIFPQGMGESHNVMVQYKGNGSPALRGFSMRNLVHSL